MFMLLLSVLGAIIGIQLLTTLGVTPNTSLIGALVAMVAARIPLRWFSTYRSVHVQNMAQTVISSATFGAANSLLLPIAVPFAFGRADLVLPMLVGVSLAMLLDGWLLYRMFDSRVFPASGAWPPGVAAAEAIKAGDQGGRQARLLALGLGVGVAGAWLSVPMSAFGTAFIGNVWALSMFGLGLLTRGYSQALVGIDIGKQYLPHGLMIGAGLVALIQVAGQLRHRKVSGDAPANAEPRLDATQMHRVLRQGAVAYVLIAAFLALVCGLYADMSLLALVGFVMYAAFAAYVHELIVGVAAMHSGWFPAFAVALITLLIGMLLGFPPVALVVLCGFSAATGPAFADMGYDLKAGFILRGNGQDPAFELEGRRHQLMGGMLAFVVAIPVVYFSHPMFFSQNLLPPVARVYATTIQAGIASGVGLKLAMWAVPGALIQWAGGPRRQLGVMLATGLLITHPMAGWAVAVGLVLRLVAQRWGGETVRSRLEVFAGGVIAGDALFSFCNSAAKSYTKSR
ncbi:OPT/YSL family transporter [Pseudacidovorax intermedius]|uniref:Membrane protein n=1 Tax=Pseudacidovorax intermedius TaxID=433924 RepID=A0A147GNH2_9BURK|nr:OPT/YSL family transporter [Pseudacidovorax intermedius]KTT15372.1 membrane protein [Pseudacidovorax intermedius]